MTEQMWGQDVEQVRALARRLDESAEQLEASHRLIDDAVRGFDGWGPVVDHMRDAWSGDLGPSLTRAVGSLHDAGARAAENADEQERTSESPGGSGQFAGASATGTAEASDGGGWFGDRLDDLGGAGDWIGDRASDLGGWFTDRGDAIWDSWESSAEAAGQLWDATGGSLLDGELPRTTEVIASGLLYNGAAIDAALAWGSGGLIESNIFDDGEPYAGDPRPVDHRSVIPPEGIDDLTRSVTEAYDAGDGVVRVTTVDSAEGPRAIVSVPGTEVWNPVTGDNPMDLTGNLVTAGGGVSTMTQAVEMAIANAGIPPGADVMLVGHSQGGMTVADLVSDADFVSEHNVTNAMTFGAPVDSDSVDPRVDILKVQHQGDVVPRLDLGDSRLATPFGSPDAGPHHTEVTMENSGPWFDPLENHKHQNYSIALESSSDPGLRAYEQQLRESGFLSGNLYNTSAVDIDIARKD